MEWSIISIMRQVGKSDLEVGSDNKTFLSHLDMVTTRVARYFSKGGHMMTLEAMHELQKIIM